MIIELKRLLAALIVAMAMFSISSVFAALDDETTSHSVSAEARFNDKINTWVDGTILSVDAGAGTFGVHGAKRPYASAYAKMLTEIHTKTAKLAAADRHTKALEIRTAWRDKLAAAQKETFDKDSDFTFHLPGKETVISSFDESRYYGKELQDSEVGARTVTDREVFATIALKDLHIGDHVVVGYESGILSNSAYAVINARYADFPNRVRNQAENAVPAKEPVAADNTAVNVRDRNKDELTADQQKQNSADIEITRNIRRAIVKDDTLSTYAHNIKIITQDGAVTLKGPVRSAAEKAEVEKQATAVAGEGHVTSQVAVAP